MWCLCVVETLSGKQSNSSLTTLCFEINLNRVVKSVLHLYKCFLWTIVSNHLLMTLALFIRTAQFSICLWLCWGAVTLPVLFNRFSHLGSTGHSGRHLFSRLLFSKLGSLASPEWLWVRRRGPQGQACLLRDRNLQVSMEDPIISGPVCEFPSEAGPGSCTFFLVKVTAAHFMKKEFMEND